MKQTITKSIFPWILTAIIFVLGFYLSTQRNNSAHNTTSYEANKFSEKQLDDKDFSVRKKLVDDFEIAFLKQYTPQIGCDVLETKVMTTECSQHLEQAKNEFKQQFIKNRGLPKDTFEELQLSFAD